MDVSIIIINFNTFHLTCNCIESIIEKTSGLQYEIILVDNASLEKDPEDFRRKFPEIVLLKNEINLGFAKGCNQGIRNSCGKYILLLNSDAELANNAITICRDFLERNRKVGVVSSRLEYPDGTAQNNCQRFPSIKYGLFELLRLQKILPEKWAGKLLLGWFFDHNSITYPDWVWGTFFMFEKSALDLLPDRKLADDFFLYVEDMQWCMEFRMRGLIIAFEPAGKVIHHMGKSGAPKSIFMMANTELFMKKYYSRFEAMMIRSISRLLTVKENQLKK